VGSDLTAGAGVSARARAQMSELDAKYRVSEQASAAMRVRRPASALGLMCDRDLLAR
jgi:hypothetical protein